MSKYVVKMVNSHTGEVYEILDEWFDNYDEAEDYAFV